MRLLLIEDSLAVAAYVEAVVRGAPDVELLPVARDGEAGVQAALTQRPDVVLMDLELPVLDGLAALERIMAEAPCPVVIFSAHLGAPGADRTFAAFHKGAVEVLAKPAGLAPQAVGAFRERLLSLVRLMAQARVVRRRPSQPAPAPAPAAGPPHVLVAVGGSTGGPEALWELLRALPAPHPAPVLVAQHILPGFEPGLAEWLRRTGHQVRVPLGAEPLRPGQVYLAEASRHLAVAPGALQLRPARPGELAPSADVLFFSAARAYGSSAVGLLLTGMGDDGARGLLELRRAGAATAAQSAETCVVDGMPGAARALGAADLSLSPQEMGRWLGARASGVGQEVA